MPPLIYSLAIIVLLAVAVALIVTPGFGALVLVAGIVCVLVVYAPRGPHYRA